MRTKLKSIFLNFILLIFFSFFVYAENNDNSLDVLINDLKKINNNLTFPTLDYSKFLLKRSKEKVKKMNEYYNRVPIHRKFYKQLTQLDNVEKVIYQKKELSNYSELNPSLTLNKLIEFKNNGGSIKSGDLIFITYKVPYSLIIQKYAQNVYCHAGIIWINHGKPYVIEINPVTDCITVPLIDFIFPAYPKLMAFTIFRYKDKLDLVEMDYILKTINNNKENIMFDKYLVMNPLIENPETYFSKDNFIYCTEIIYLIYQYLLNNTKIISDFRVDMKNFLNYYAGDNSVFKTLIELSIYVDKHSNTNDIISPRNFIESNYFTPLIEVKAEKQ